MFENLFGTTPDTVLEVPEPQIEKTWELVAKTYAPPLRTFNKEIDDMATLQKVLFGVTTCVWQCAQTGEIRKEEILGSDESQLRDILEKVDRAGGALQYIKENNKIYAIMEYVPETT